MLSIDKLQMEWLIDVPSISLSTSVSFFIAIYGVRDERVDRVCASLYHLSFRVRPIPRGFYHSGI